MKRVRVDLLEDAVERVVSGECVDSQEAARLQTGIRNAIRDVQAAEEETNAQLRKALAQLKIQEERLSTQSLMDCRRRPS